MPPTETPAMSTRPSSRASNASRTSRARSATVTPSDGGRGADPPCPRVSIRTTRKRSASAAMHGSHISVVVPREFSSTIGGASSGPSMR